ncbi:MAG TPA: biopolymer transporter ExbD [Gemmatimonadota bacterium]|nr:biopolymer transporter ExbD [Gemmatimonadota bacterium]
MAGPLKREHGLMAEINVTSLVDVTIVLLIMFMIIAPIAQGGIEVRIPRAETAPLPSSEAVLVSMDEEGRVFVDRTEIQPDQVGEVLTQLRSSRGLGRVYVRADERIPYGDVARLMGRIRQAEFENIGLVFEAAMEDE